MTNIDTSHLNALRVRLSHERVYFANAKKDGERALRTVWVAQIEKEISAELAFLGMVEDAADDAEMTDDELLASLAA